MNRRTFIKLVGVPCVLGHQRKHRTDFIYGHVNQPYREYMHVYLDGQLCMSRLPGGHIKGNGMGVQEANAIEGWVRYYPDPYGVDIRPPLLTATGSVQILFPSDEMRREWVNRFGKTEYTKFLA